MGKSRYLYHVIMKQWLTSHPCAVVTSLCQRILTSWLHCINDQTLWWRYLTCHTPNHRLQVLLMPCMIMMIWCVTQEKNWLWPENTWSPIYHIGRWYLRLLHVTGGKWKGNTSTVWHWKTKTLNTASPNRFSADLKYLSLSLDTGIDFAL